MSKFVEEKEQEFAEKLEAVTKSFVQAEHDLNESLARAEGRAEMLERKLEFLEQETRDMKSFNEQMDEIMQTLTTIRGQ